LMDINDNGWSNSIVEFIYKSQLTYIAEF